MKKHFLLSLAAALMLGLSLLPAPAFAAEGGVAITKDNFPDANFRDAVSRLPGAQDNYLDAEELKAVTSINVSHKYLPDSFKIHSMAGIEHFTFLENLDCSGNLLTELDISKNPALVELYCYANQLTELDIGKKYMLETVICADNQISLLTTGDTPNLTFFDCSDNDLTGLKVGLSPKLETLSCRNNKLSSLTLTENPALVDLDASDNMLFNMLDLSKNTKLISLSLSDNDLHYMDLSNNPELTYLTLDRNMLTALDLSGLKHLSRPSAQDQFFPVKNGNGIDYLYLGNMSRVSNITGGKFQDGKVSYTDQRMSYQYDCGGGLVMDCTLEDSSADTHTMPGYQRVARWNFDSKRLDGFEYGLKDGCGWRTKRNSDLEQIETHHGTGAMVSRNFLYQPTPDSPDNWLISRSIDYSVPTVMSFSVKSNSGQEKLGIYVLEQGKDPVQLGQDYTLGTDWQEITVDLSAYAGTPIQVAFVHRAVSSSAMVTLDCVCFWQPIQSPFTDVKEGDWYFDPVMWAVEKGITSGMTPTEFGSFTECNRAQIVTFLWSAAGKPAPTLKDNPFTDVPEGAWFHDAVLWAVENGITGGMTSTTFGPTATCNRAQAMTFLWKYMKQPAASVKLQFTDVQKGAWYEKPVQWAVENGITSGLTKTEFGTTADCLRSQIVTFMYKALNK